jgi:YHS domain-containing protein
VPAAEFLLGHLSRTLYDPVDPTRLASLDPKLRARVNGEIYRFASAASMAKFLKDPRRYCGIVRDPVSGHCFVPDRDAKDLEYIDGPYFFTCDSTRMEFSRNPGRWAIHRDY